MCQTSECECGCGPQAHRHHPHRMMGHPHQCHPHHPHHQMGGHHPGGGCCAPGHGFQHFPTKEDVVSGLEEYLKQLQEEARSIEEHIENLKKGEA